MSSNDNYPPGGPPPFGPPPTSTSNSNNNNTAPAAAESPSSVDSEAFADIDVIVCGIKDDIGALLSSLQQYARKREDGESVGLSAALDVRFHLMGQQDLDGCVRFVRTHGREMQEWARRVFGEDAERWEEDEIESEVEQSGEGVLGEEDSGDGEGEDGVGLEEDGLADESEEAVREEDVEEYVASEKDIATIQWMEAHEATEVAQRLQTLQDDILRDIPLLSEEEREHRVGPLWHQVHGDHWSEVVEARLKGERVFG